MVHAWETPTGSVRWWRSCARSRRPTSTARPLWLTAEQRSRCSEPSGHEVFGPRVVADDGIGRLLGMELKSFAHLHPDPRTVEELVHLGVVLQLGAGGISPRVAATAVLLAEQAGERGTVFMRKTPLFADAVVPVLHQRFGHLSPETVQEQVVGVAILRIEPSRLF